MSTWIESKDPTDPLTSVQEELEVVFRDPELLRLALVHSSYLNENPGVFPESNDRLEFLGDALTGLVTAHRLYQMFPSRTEGELTTLRSALVRSEALAGAASRLKLGQFLLLGRGEEAGGGRERPSNLAGAFEALVGALFLDQGYDAARDFVLRALSPELSALDRCRLPENPKSLLQELVQVDGAPAPSYRVVKVSGEPHARQFMVEVEVAGRVLGRGDGPRKSNAEQEAAGEALRALEHDV